MSFGALLAAVIVVSGCASFDGSSLVAGKSAAAEVEALMGAPAERVASADGGQVLYYPRQPAGRRTFVVSIGADGVMRSIEQRLAQEHFGKLAAGTSTANEVRELLGPPVRVVRMERVERDVWDYPYLHYSDFRIHWVQSPTTAWCASSST